MSGPRRKAATADGVSILPLDGSGPSRLLVAKRSPGGLSFSPDDSQLVYGTATAVVDEHGSLLERLPEAVVAHIVDDHLTARPRLDMFMPPNVWTFQ